MRNMVGLLTALALSTAIVIGQGERLLHAQNANDPNGADSQSEDKTNPGFSQGIRIGSVKDGKVAAFIPRSRYRICGRTCGR